MLRCLSVTSWATSAAMPLSRVSTLDATNATARTTISSRTPPGRPASRSKKGTDGSLIPAATRPVSPTARTVSRLRTAAMPVAERSAGSSAAAHMRCQ